MSVLQITKLCSLNCTYCFDKVHQNEAKINKDWFFLKDEDFYKYLSRMNQFFQNKKEDKSICLSGWEPTLHPSFKKFVRSATNDNFKIYLLSNLSFDEDTRKFLKHYFDNGYLSCMTNINSPDDRGYSWMNDKLWENTIQNLEELQKPNIRFSFNIFDPEISYNFIYDLVERFPHMDDMIRIWIENTILPELRNRKTYVFHKDLWPKYQKLGKVIDEIIAKLHSMWKKIYFDCGAGWCIFDPKTISSIRENDGIIHGCSLPNDEVQTKWQYSTCYALYNYWNEQWEYNIQKNTMKQLRWISILQTEFFKNHYLLLPKCTNCPMLEQWCPRFCVSNNINYWGTVFDWEEKHSKEFLADLDYQKLSQDQKNYAYIEYLLSKQRFDEAREFMGKNQDLFSTKDRYWLYDILIEFFINLDKKKSLDRFYSFVEWKNFDSKDLDLAKLVELVVKNNK